MSKHLYLPTFQRHLVLDVCISWREASLHPRQPANDTDTLKLVLFLMIFGNLHQHVTTSRTYHKCPLFH